MRFASTVRSPECPCNFALRRCKPFFVCSVSRFGVAVRGLVAKPNAWLVVVCALPATARATRPPSSFFASKRTVPKTRRGNRCRPTERPFLRVSSDLRCFPLASSRDDRTDRTTKRAPTHRQAHRARHRRNPLTKLSVPPRRKEKGFQRRDFAHRLADTARRRLVNAVNPRQNCVFSKSAARTRRVVNGSVIAVSRQ